MLFMQIMSTSSTYKALHTLWGYGPQDMGRTIGGGPAHKIKACTALLGVHRKTLYSTK